MSYNVEREIALRAVLRASLLCSYVQSSIKPAESASKEDKTPVTIADFGSQALINLELRANFPDDAVIAEEDSSLLRTPEGRAMLEMVSNEVQRIQPGMEDGDILEAIDHGKPKKGDIPRYWTIDPIDGTKGFLRGEQYSVCLALIEDGEVVLGVLGCPKLGIDPLPGGSDGGTLFTATKGEGAFMRKIGDRTDIPVRVSRLRDPSRGSFLESLDSTHSSHEFSARVAAILGVRKSPIRVDSQVKYAALARGDAPFYLRFPLRKDYREKVWDHAPGYLIAEEAGGRVTDARGKDVDFSRGGELIDLEGIVATNGLLHDQVLEAVRAVMEEEGFRR